MNIRLWPGAAAAALLLLLRFAVPLVVADGSLISILGSVIAAAVILLWWLFFSRAPWAERIGVVALMAGATYVTSFFVHRSIYGGMMNMMLPIYFALPWLPVALVAAVVLTHGKSATVRRLAIAVATVFTCIGFTLIRTDGLKGGTPQITWRWTPTAEDRLLAHVRDTPSPVAPPAPAPSVAPTLIAAKPIDETAAAVPAAASAAVRQTAPIVDTTAASAKMVVKWPGFRGPARDSVVRGVQIDTEWSTSPPAQLWREPIGPGWSSFAVAGDVLFTQEQRGEDELVAAYSVTTGKPVWTHKDKARFYESNGGAGPRGTPALSHGRVYSLGATGILNALDAASGATLWSRNTVRDTGVTIPGWGITSSPLAVDDVVVVAVSGALAAYDASTGAPRWSRKSSGGSYSSPHLVTIDGARQIILMASPGATSVAPADGALLWQYGWHGVPIVQPAQVAGGDFLLTTADGMGALGMRRISVTHDGGAWKAAERWTSNGLKPYFNDFVIHKGHAYGFDGSILSCISIEDGARKWKGGRYGNGQFVLLPDQDLLLVLSEEGELALVSATPDTFAELARFKAIEGKTWNHPVLIGDVLLVRNGEEMAAFRLPVAGR